MGIKVITPASAVLTLAEMRLHLRLDTVGGVHPDDTLISSLLSSAVQYCEHYTQRSVGSQTLELALDAFPDGPISLPKGPLQSVTSVSYVNTAGTTTTLSNTLYAIDDYGLEAWLITKYGTSWPDTEGSANCVKVRYVAGSIEPAVKSAILLILAHLYENRENSSVLQLKSLPMGVDSLLDTVKAWSI
jgi:uncharacterized phiE125 gp8 family phage protein